MRRLLVACAAVSSLAVPARAVLVTPPLYTDGSPVSCSVMNLGNPTTIRIWIIFDDLTGPLSFCPPSPVATRLPDTLKPNYPDNSCYYICNKSVNQTVVTGHSKACTVPAFTPPAGHTVICAMSVPGVSLRELIHATLSVGKFTTTMRAEE